ncbi:MAG: hypothetical protein EHM42_06120 [Planctomycetaceae bacterium]|nr:MAG: hypothetical protein EHM42_06120 [Planctomycetaceae bacterium]
MGVSVFGLGVVAIGAVVLLAAVVAGTYLAVTAMQRRREKRSLPADFPAAVCQGCAASIPAGTRICPVCGHLA